MAIIPVELKQLDTQQFIGVRSGDALNIQVKVSEDQNNMLQSTDGGLLVIPRVETPATFVATHNNSAVSVNTDFSARRTLYVVSNGFGYLHLDFTARGATATRAFTLPDNAPRPLGLLEVQTWDGGTLWIDAGANVVKFGGLTANRRYIVDIVGFWRTQ